MADRRLNVLVYTGTGTTVESVRHCMYSLSHLLAPNYAVIPVTEGAILNEPWAPTCALLVIPGGADLGYCRVFNGPGNRRIADYVRRGGSYLGLCAGGYYGSARCEFEVGNRPLEVIGSRELAFFPGTCRGGAFKGFEYRGEQGAKAAKLRVATAAFTGEAPEETVAYFNGGGVFVDAAGFADKGVEVLASYLDETAVDGGDGNAAVIFCRVGDGKAVLTGPHPEFAAVNLTPQPGVPDYADLMRKLDAADGTRTAFLRACLVKLGLESASPNSAAVPPLTSLHLSAMRSSDVTQLLASWEDIVDRDDGDEIIRGETDTFKIESEATRWGVKTLQKALAEVTGEAVPRNKDGIVDYAAVVKTIIPHEDELPHPRSTPQFNHDVFYASLRRYRQTDDDAEHWGDVLMYGEVVTSTNILLVSNPKLVATLQTGFTLAASTQIAGRGRGTNVWVAPPGSLIFSTVINHPANLAATRPVVFVQYLAAVAIVEAIQSYDEGYEKLPVKLKWPNDIYALDPSKPAEDKAYVKIGGILSQCVYSQGAYQIVLGIGINATNPRPTVSLSDLLPPPTAAVAPLRVETLLARVLSRLESAYAQFRREGFSRDLEGRYYRHWLHTGQKVTLEAEGGMAARVLGITPDWGMLRVEQTDGEGRGTGKIWALQSDENSFDYWRGLVKRKV